MSEVQRLLIEEDGETYEIYIEANSNPNIQEPSQGNDGKRPGEKGVSDKVRLNMEKVRKMIRGYAVFAFSAFKDFPTAQVEEVTLKFGVKIGGKSGIPYITEGSAESSLEVQVKCKYPSQQESD